MKIKRKVKQIASRTRRKTAFSIGFGTRYKVTWVEGKTGRHRYKFIYAKDARQALRRVRKQLGMKKIQATGAQSFHSTIFI